MSELLYVTDALGDEWCLLLRPHYRLSEKGLWEMRLLCLRTPMEYARIPVPVFTDWWPA